MSEGPYGVDPGRGGFTLEPQGMPLQPFFDVGWGPRKPFGPQHGFGPGPIPNIPMYRRGAGFTEDAHAAGSDAYGIIPPLACPAQCPAPVAIDLCIPQRPGDWGSDIDAWGDPAEFIPPGVRTVPEWTPRAVKNGTGGKTLVGPGGAYIFPTPMLPETPRGLPIPAGELVGSSGAVSDSAPVPAGPLGRIPWWGWALGAVVAVKLLGGRR